MRCHDARLKQLLAADESSAEYQVAANHVEGCSRCQQRLVELTDDHTFLVELRETLQASDEAEPYRASINSSVVISVEANGMMDAGAESEPVSLDFLAPPSHPEMLGRIGRYEVERMIGSGGMGIVLKGFDTELHRVVAIKVLKPHLAHNGAARHRFAREAQSAAAVVHEHVIPIHDVQSDGDMPFLVMQYVPGQSLQARVDERGPLDPKEVLRIARQVAAGLAAAHAQGLVHRDVKPANILMEESVERVLISDFGLARTVDDATLTRTGIVAGTPHYMSPEQASGHAVDHRSDLFSLGSVLYFMCTGRPPFRAEHAMAILNRICHDTHRPVDEVNHDIPAELAEAIDQLLAKVPGDRFRNAHEVEQRFEWILSQLQSGRRPVRFHWRRRWLRWRATVQKTVLSLCAAVACVFVGVGLASWHRSDPHFTTGMMAQSSMPDSIEQTQDLSPGQEPLELPPRFVGAMEFPPDNFANELTSVQQSLSDIEHDWNGQDAALSEHSTDLSDWQRNLSSILDALKTLELGSSGSQISPKSVYQPPQVERAAQ
ncbi:MAG: prkC 8 [Schlesneria sp.]|nr:prkC 8 [Schlesneria sp.]